MKQPLLWGALILALIVAIGVACFQWGRTVAEKRAATAPRETTYVQILGRIDTVEVWPNPAPARTIENPETVRRVDSLIATLKNRDSTLRFLCLPKTSEQSWSAESPTGIRVVGRIFALFDPTTEEMLHRVTADSVSVWERIITIHEYLETTNWLWTSWIAVAAFLIGALAL